LLPAGIRKATALKHTIGFELRSVSRENADKLVHGSREGLIHEIAGEVDGQISPDELDMLQRTFDRVCIWCNIPRYGKRADRLARQLTGQFRSGISDETALFESAMWLEQHFGATWRRSDA
jgi:hypothetical protein